MKTKVLSAVALIFLSVFSSFSQGWVSVTSIDYTSAASNSVWSSQQNPSGGASVSSAGSTSTGAQFGAGIWNVSLYYSGGSMFCTVSNAGSLTPISSTSQLAANGSSVSSLYFGLSARGSTGSPASTSISDVYLNGVLVPAAVATVSGASTTQNYFELSVNSGNFSSLNLNLALTSANAVNFLNVIAVSPVPEPGTTALAILGGASLLLFRKRK